MTCCGPVHNRRADPDSAVSVALDGELPAEYPRSLSDLLKDPRKPGIERYLRQLYPHPVTGKEWVTVKAPDRGVMGVHSLSSDKPLKTAQFHIRDRGFEGAASYSDWKFVYVPPSAQKPAQQRLQQPGAPSPR